MYGSLLVLAFLIAYCAISPDPPENRLAVEASQIVVQIESFKKDKERLPNSLSEIGIEEKDEGPIYYRKEGEGKYILWFRTELGESVTYDSESRKWKQK